MKEVKKTPKAERHFQIRFPVLKQTNQSLVHSLLCYKNAGSGESEVFRPLFKCFVTEKRTDKSILRVL